ncbi:MAG: VWA domain-containing protein, partial [Deltaproteobacteria bacterium]|nr:VWA domain-containing protein [Deltaproteobacteria bacterium]MBW2530145.1 VWA domain-containing protein [Deltaproteobacteria bacterium]
EHAFVELEGADAIAADDRAPVLEPSTLMRIGIVADAEGSRPPTGGPPPVEQALGAMGHAGHMSLLTAVPDDADSLQGLSVLIVDDPPGFAPELRRRLAAWVEGGGVLVLTLGPRAGAARLGSGFAPMLPAVVRWAAWSRSGAAPGSSPAPVIEGVDPETDDWFGPSAKGLTRLSPSGRALLEVAPGQELRIRTRWSDGQPFWVERRIGRGVTFALTVPLGAKHSDFPLRPAFLLLLQRVVDTARTLGGVARSSVGTTWVLPAAEQVVAERQSPSGSAEPVEVTPRAEQWQLVPDQLGLYRLTVDGTATFRVAAVEERELLARPRSLGEGADDPQLGSTTASVDISRHVALVLLLLLAAELALRSIPRRRTR